MGRIAEIRGGAASSCRELGVNQESPTETVELDGWHSSHTSVSHTERIKNNPGRNLLRFELLAAEKNSKPPRGTNKFKVLSVVVC
jgi:hypothetical protein